MSATGRTLVLPFVGLLVLVALLGLVALAGNGLPVGRGDPSPDGPALDASSERSAMTDDSTAVPREFLVNQDQVAAALADLESPSETVRSEAARRLHRLEHPRALEACLATINDAPDPLHLDMTPSVQCLREIGEPALPPLLDLLASEDRMTRLRAERAVLWITKIPFGFDGQQWRGDGLEEWSEWWREIGYDSDAEAIQRNNAVARLREWSARR